MKNAVLMLEEQSDSRAKAAVETVHIQVARGESLSAALSNAEVFPKLLCGIVSIGESGGRLSEIIAQAADYYERRAETENELIGALTYPALVSLLMLIVMVIAVTFVLPSYAQVFAASDATLPFLTQVLMNVSDFFMSYWPVILIGFIGVVLIIKGWSLIIFLDKSE